MSGQIAESPNVRGSRRLNERLPLAGVGGNGLVAAFFGVGGSGFVVAAWALALALAGVGGSGLAAGVELAAGPPAAFAAFWRSRVGSVWLRWWPSPPSR